MDQLPLFTPKTPDIWSVSGLTGRVRQLLEESELQNVWVEGEISNLSQPRSGHVYFTLKDQQASLRCVIWRSSAQRLRVALQNGQAVEVKGSIGVYEQSGQYQLYVTSVRLAGEGLLYQEYLRLKAALEAEGLFDPERKRELPAFPHKIGIVCSPTAAALQDMLNTLGQRFPLAEVVLSPASVQGDAAPPEIVHALAELNEKVKPDVILLARGGGSLEDLWCFNDERVVRAVAASPTPVVTGVGHETDFTLVDFVSDLRAPTPTGAAVLATPDIEEIDYALHNLYSRLAGAYQYRLDELRTALSDQQQHLKFASPGWKVQNDLQRLDELSERLERAIRQDLKIRALERQDLHNRLNMLNPLAVLKRGYALVTDEDGKVIHQAEELTRDQQIQVRLADGRFDARVAEIHRDE